jgi:hypothetical protein
MLMASPALLIPMNRCGRICQIHHRYHFGVGRIEKIEVKYSDVRHDIAYGKNRLAEPSVQTIFRQKQVQGAPRNH